MRKILFTAILAYSFTLSFSQKKNASSNPGRPALVVGIVVDQMRWDYLYKYYDRFGEQGFKRLLQDGFSCENTLINYLPSFTAVGHTTIFTGATPGISGITGNGWIDQLTGKEVYCTDDSTVSSIGAESVDGKMSPRNLLASTITDELRLATNFKSKVVGISLKDRAAILPAGHLANAAFWLDDSSGNFITSSYYMQQLPDWVNTFNKCNRVKELVANGWNTLYNINTYTQSDEDEQPYEGLFPGETKSVFPHDLQAACQLKKESFRESPFGNTLTLEMAAAALNAYQLGKNGTTDFLAINCASTDYVGHKFGPNSIEVEDTYLRLDKDLAVFLQTLDAKVGKGKYLVFLTADHGAAHAVNFMKQHKMPADFWNGKKALFIMNDMLKTKFGKENLIRSFKNYQINFDLSKIEENHLDYDAIKRVCIGYLQKQPGVNYAVDMQGALSAAVPQTIREMIANSYTFKRSGGIQVILNPGWFEGYKTGTTHGAWCQYDTHIPLLWYGWNISPGKTTTKVHMTDIAATLAALLHIQMPNGCTGNVIEALMKKQCL